MVHSLPGRVRLRIPATRCADGPSLARRLASVPDVRDARWSPAARSLAVQFDRTASFQEVVDRCPERPVDPDSSGGAPATGASSPRGPLWRHFLLPAVSLTAGIAGLAPLSTATIAVCAIPMARRAVEGVTQRHLNVDVLDATAVSLLLGTGDLLAAGISVALVESGERIRERASGRARRVFTQMLGADPRGVRMLRDGTEPRVPTAEVRVGDHAVVYAGETVPIDGVVLDGAGSIDNRTWTGEPYPVPVELGMPVLAGGVVQDGRLVIEVRATGSQTRAGRLAAAIEDAVAANTQTTDLARRIADRFVIPVLLASGTVFVVTRNVGRLVSMLIIDFGTGIRVAVPTSILMTMITGARQDVIFKQGQAIEDLARVTTIVFDKTGTLTSGRPAVVGVEARGTWSEDEMLRLAAAAEGHFPHPMARAIRRHARREGLRLPEPRDVRLQPGGGVTAAVEGHQVVVGRRRLLEEHGVAPPRGLGRNGSVALVAIDGRFAGTIHTEDGVRDDAKEVIRDLRAAGVRELWLATGDRSEVAASVAAELGLDGHRGGMMPEEKVDLVHELQAQGKVVAVVGDGINDAAAMAEASVGVAVSRGADMARETAQVVLATEDLGALVDAVRMARFAMGLVRQNIALVAAPNAAALGLATVGLLNPISATAFNNGSTLLASGNALRPLRFRGRRMSGA
ncbi:MAG: Cation-transporting ATPase [Chloroflexi bacterium]|nr:Cation-transporting ATPase [Chloroflexota bacterium]